jgi:anti-repressor protein
MTYIAGSSKTDQPSNWLANAKTQALVDEVKKSIPGNSGIQSKQGLGTFVCKELVYAYAMWISPAFHLKVIRAFDALVSGRMFGVPQTLAQALRLAADQSEEIERQAALIESNKPKVEFAEAIRKDEDGIDMLAMAKLLGYGRNSFMAQLREDGILMENNLPYQPYINRGYFLTTEKPIQRSDGSTKIVHSTLVTGAGQVYLQRKYAPALA